MSKSPLVAVVMESRSDLRTMQHAIDTLKQLDIPYHAQVISAHRAPDLLHSFSGQAREEGFEIIIAGASDAAHLPGMIAAKCSLPVLGVPTGSESLNGVDALLSIAQMSQGVPVGTLAIGVSGAINAALLAASILGNKYPEILKNLENYRCTQTTQALNDLFIEENK